MAIKFTATTDVTTISIDDFAKFTADELKFITKDQSSSLSAAQIGTLTDRTLPSLASKFSSITPEALAGLSLKTVPFLMIRAITVDQIAGLTVDQFKAFKSDQVSALSVKQLNAMNADQFGAFMDLMPNFSTFRNDYAEKNLSKGWDLVVWSNLNNFENDLAKIRDIENFIVSQYERKVAVIEAANPRWANLGALNVSAMTSDNFPMLLPEQIAGLTFAQLGSLTK